MQVLFDHLHDNYSDYFEKSKSNDVNIIKNEYTNWSVRKSSHSGGICKSIYSKFNAKEDNTISLHEKGVYVETYELEAKSYRMTIYSAVPTVHLKNDKVRLKGYNELANHTYVKAGYTKKYGIIVFYDDNMQLQMLLQISGSDSPDKVTKQWLNYLAIVVASDEQKEFDKSVWDKIKDGVYKLFTREELPKVWADKEEHKDILLKVDWIGQFSNDLKDNSNCHWCGQTGTCCNGGTSCLTCPNDSTKKCCMVACKDTLQATACDSCSNHQQICATGTCKTNDCCFQAALAMIKPFGVTTDRDQAIDIATANKEQFQNQKQLIIDPKQFEEAVTYIDETLKSDKPILIGVHYPNTYKKPYNTNNATLHFMIIVGKKYDKDKEYYRFYDPGRSLENDGKAESNLLEIDKSQNMIHGMYRDKIYTITEVRKNL